MSQAKVQARTVDISLSSPFDGWTATMKADGIPARVFIELQSGSVERSMSAVERLIVKHNFLDESGEPATSVLDAPMDALSDAISKWSEAVAALPPR
jgi:hypothetical protein